MNLPDKALGKAVEAATKFVGQIINPPPKRSRWTICGPGKAMAF